MSVTVPAQSWGLLLQQAHTANPARRGYVPLVADALKQYWSDVLPRGACRVLEWLTARTAGTGTPAAVGTLRQLLQPYVSAVGVVIHPLSISLNSLRSHLQLLTSKKLVNVYEIDDSLGGKQNAPRAFEIDFKVVVLHPYCSKIARNKVLLIESTVCESSLFGVPPPKMGSFMRARERGISFIYRHEVPSCRDHWLGIPNLFLSASPIGGCKGEPLPVQPVGGSLKTISLAQPKKQRAAQQRPDSVAAVLAQAKTKAADRATSTKAKTAAGATDKQTMQNYLNELMREFYPKQPRLVVTDKPLGVMRKRLSSYGITDYRELLRFSISEWSEIAKKNRQGFTRKILSGAKVTPMAEYPSFAELAYRLPYFITIFNSGTYTPASEVEDNEKERLRNRIASLEREVAGTKERLRRTVRPAAPAAEPSAVIRRPVTKRAATPTKSSTEWTPPAWE